MTSANQLDETFAALSHAVRRQILARLAEGDATVNELSEPFDISLPAISRHIKVLEKAGLVARRRYAQFRPCTLNVERLREVASWTERYRPIWEARFDRLEQVLLNTKGETNDGT